MKKVTRALAAMMLAAAVVFATGCKKDNDINVNTGDNNGLGGGGGTNHEYVDLGLPSGTLWATCNVGATTPEGYGDYFAWGETQPKSYYDWSTYKYCNGGNSNQLTKYCDYPYSGYNGFTDNLTILQPTDDAATANWGNGWSTPTREQWQELIDNTTHTWTTRNGVNGRLYTASNGQKLFLPAGGNHLGSNLCSVGSCGYYWTSVLYGLPSDAGRLLFDSLGNSSEILNEERADGLSVRPVRNL